MDMPQWAWRKLGNQKRQENKKKKKKQEMGHRAMAMELWPLSCYYPEDSRRSWLGGSSVSTQLNNRLF